METPESHFHISSSNNNGYYRTISSVVGQPEMRLSEPKPEQFTVEEFFDFSNHDDDNIVLSDNAATAFDNVTNNNNKNANTTGLNSSESSSVTVVDSCNSSFSGNELPRVLEDMKGCRNFQEGNFSGDLCVPNDDLAELNQWLSDFTEDSFSSDDLQKLQLISGMNARPEKSSVAREFQPEFNEASQTFPTEIPVPGKARSKRSRAAPCNWASRLLLLSKSRSSSSLSLESDAIIPVPKKTVKLSMKKEESDNGLGDGRKCLHCATDKTPQWRTGPMGPKTLCNACGVRYKSGRLVPEYRPAASPTFVLTKHSNSHRKVLELRRQKEMQQRSQQQQYIHHHHPNMVFDRLPNGEDYLIHQHMGPDFRQLI